MRSLNKRQLKRERMNYVLDVLLSCWFPHTTTPKSSITWILKEWIVEQSSCFFQCQNSWLWLISRVIWTIPWYESPVGLVRLRQQALCYVWVGSYVGFSIAFLFLYNFKRHIMIWLCSRVFSVWNPMGYLGYDSTLVGIKGPLQDHNISLCALHLVTCWIRQNRHKLQFICCEVFRTTFFNYIVFYPD